MKHLFFRMPRTGSTFITKLFQTDYQDKVEIVNHDYLYENGKKDTKGLREDHMWRFCFIRNPYTRFVSAYRWLKVPRKYNRVDTIQKEAVARFKNIKEFCRNLEEFVARPENYPIHFYPQSEWITDAAGNLTMDHLGKFEEMNESWKIITDKLGIPYSPVHNVHQKSLRGKASFLRKKIAGDYSQEMDEEVYELLYTYYRRDFELFNYPKNPGSE